MAATVEALQTIESSGAWGAAGAGTPSQTDSYNEVITRSTRAGEEDNKEEERPMKIRRYVMARRLGVVAVVAAALVATATPPLGVAATSVPEPAPPTSPPPESAPTASPPAVAMTLEETQAVMDAYVAALVGREDIAPYFSDDAFFELVDVGQRVEGRDEVVAAIAELHEQTFDAHPEVTNLVVGEGMAAIEAVFVGTQMEEFAGIPASGQQVAVPYAVFYDLADGKITALRIHGFVTGLVAALTAGATATSTAP
jgi:steroid delta-isomerase-like uncharacterized protein